MFRKNRKLFRHTYTTFASVFTTIASSNKYCPLYGFKTKGQKALAIARRGKLCYCQGFCAFVCLCRRKRIMPVLFHHFDRFAGYVDDVNWNQKPLTLPNFSIFPLPESYMSRRSSLLKSATTGPERSERKKSLLAWLTVHFAYAPALKAVAVAATSINDLVKFFMMK